MRQYTFGALLIASMPEAKVFESGEANREEYAERAGRVIGMAAETFNDGLRAYYMSFAALMWFSSPLAFALATPASCSCFISANSDRTCLKCCAVNRAAAA